MSSIVLSILNFHNVTKNVQNYIYFPCVYLGETKFENYYISNNSKTITNYKSIHFIMGGKELTEQEIQNFTLKDPKNEIINLNKDNRDLLGTLLCQSCLK